MSELRDYQRLLIDNIIEDINECIPLLTNKQARAIGLKLESRIETYDRERKEQIERDLPSIVARAVSEYIL